MPSPPLSPERALRRLDKLNAVLDVAKALSGQHTLDSLLPLILREAARVVEADRCSLFILDRDKNELWSRVAQGTSAEIRLPASKGLVGAVARSGQPITLVDAYDDPRFNKDFDLATGYRTKSVLCVPMRNAQGEVTGVIQALNATDGAFDTEDEELLLALGAQAAGAIDNALLHEEINRLFEGFVSASVVAIESRDPTTAGHSGRVASLTVLLAKAVEHAPNGPYQGLTFSQTEIQELRYASLLHDFGKVGVREPVLVKAEKLYPHELEVLKARFDVARKDRQLQSCRRCLDAVRSGRPLADAERDEQAALQGELSGLDEMLAFVLACNRPTVLAEGGFERLRELAQVRFTDGAGKEAPLLTTHETQVLSIPRGSLSEVERREIESHVTHTFKFLQQIPWTRSLRRVPEIAYAHHEKLNGRGYPRSIPDPQIPVQSKMMAIADIYDALTASDRPYKKAVPHEKALDILQMESKSGQLDKDLLEVFVGAEIPRRALQWK